MKQNKTKYDSKYFFVIKKKNIKRTGVTNDSMRTEASQQKLAVFLSLLLQQHIISRVKLTCLTKPSSCSLLVGEQSSAWWILLLVKAGWRLASRIWKRNYSRFSDFSLHLCKYDSTIFKEKDPCRSLPSTVLLACWWSAELRVSCLLNWIISLRLV